MSESDDGQSVTLHLDGLPENDSEVRLSVFIEKLNAFREALREADRFLSGGRSLATAKFYIQDLRKNSPSAVTVREHADTLIDDRVMSASQFVTETVSSLTIGASAVNEPVYPLLEKLKDLGDGWGRKYSRIWFSRGDVVVASMTPSAYDATLQLLKGTISSVGSVIGKVERYNSHGAKNFFNVFPSLGGRIRCNFSNELLDKAVSAVEKRVIVYGMLRYREGEFYPYEVDMTDLEIIEMTEDEETSILPSLLGVAPRATGDESAEDFIKRLRNGWN